MKLFCSCFPLWSLVEGVVHNVLCYKLHPSSHSKDYLQLVRRCYVERYLQVYFPSHLHFYLQEATFCIWAVSKGLLMRHHYKSSKRNKTSRNKNTMETVTTHKKGYLKILLFYWICSGNNQVTNIFDLYNNIVLSIDIRHCMLRGYN